MQILLQSSAKAQLQPNLAESLVLFLNYPTTITQSGSMGFVLNLDKVSLKKLFPTMNIKKVRVFNIDNRKYGNVRKLPCTGLWK